MTLESFAIVLPLCEVWSLWAGRGGGGAELE